MLVNLVICLMLFVGVLALGVVGLGLFQLLPKKIKDKIKNFHN